MWKPWFQNITALRSLGGGQKATPAHFQPYRIPRLPIRRSDDWLFFRAKVQGWLASEEAVYAWLRRDQDGR